ncbi:unnamed protein product, partial [Durusdinium trenchii]
LRHGRLHRSRQGQIYPLHGHPRVHGHRRRCLHDLCSPAHPGRQAAALVEYGPDQPREPAEEPAG